MKKILGAALCAIGLAMPAYATNSAAWYTKTEKGFGDVTITAESAEFKNVEYVAANDKRSCSLKLSPRHRSDWLKLVDKSCDGKVDELKYGNQSSSIADIELSRNKVHKELFNKADLRYKEIVAEYRLQKQVDDYFDSLDKKLDDMLTR